MKYYRIINTIFILILFLSACTKKEDIKNIDYYTCGMHPSVKVMPEDYKPGETKCPICAMDLVPVYKKGIQDHNETMTPDQEKPLSTIKLSTRQEILADVQTSRVSYQQMNKEITTSGTIEYDETKIAYVSAYINGRIDKLFINFTGARVKKNQALALIYSPELVSTQEEYLNSIQTASYSNDISQTLAESAKERLKLWGIKDKEVDQIKSTGKPKLHMTIVSPISGIVLHKNIIQGQYVKQGEPLYHIADLSTIWMKADIFENEFSLVKIGQNVEIDSIAFPGENFSGHITFIDPVLNPQTRTVKVRVEINNLQLKLKPGMYVTARIKIKLGKRLVIPRQAILDTGIRKIVYLKLRQEKDGSLFLPVKVSTGIEDEEYIEIKHGLKSKDEVVTTASFLIDSQAELTGVESAGYSGALDTHKH